jgi:hypothetical protein
MIAIAASLLVSVLGGFAWLISRMDARFARADETASARFERVEAELVEIKVAIARMEGRTE